MNIQKTATTKPAIYFDIGGVLMYDFLGEPLCKSTFERVAKMVAGCDPIMAEKLFNDHWEDIDLGRMNLSDQAREMGLDPEHYCTALEEIHVFIPERLDLVRRLQAGGYQVGLATNFNGALLRGVMARIPEFPTFDAICCSGFEGVAKPDTGFFETAQRLMGSSNILFIDDRLRNVKAARIFGWDTIHAVDESWTTILEHRYLK